MGKMPTRAQHCEIGKPKLDPFNHNERIEHLQNTSGIVRVDKKGHGLGPFCYLLVTGRVSSNQILAQMDRVRRWHCLREP